MILLSRTTYLIPICNTGYSSVGRAIDCRSIGRVFNSHCPDLTWI